MQQRPIWCVKPEVFTIWSFKENICQLLTYQIKSKLLNMRYEVYKRIPASFPTSSLAADHHIAYMPNRP